MDKLGYAAFSPAKISKIMEQASTDSTVTLQGRAFTLPVEAIAGINPDWFNTDRKRWAGRPAALTY